MVTKLQLIASVTALTLCWTSCLVPGVGVAFAQDDKSNQPFLAVVGFRTAETAAEAFLRSQLVDEFNRSDRARIVPEPLTSQVVDDIWTEDKSTSRKLVKEASAHFSEGKKFYGQLSMEDAINSFNKSVIAYREGIGALRDNRYLLISHLYLGMALIVLGRKQEGENFIREMVILDSNRSQRKLSPTEFPPEVLTMHRNLTKQVLSAPMGNLVVRYAPANAKVYVDAVLQESKDVVTADLPVGEHFVVVEKKGFRQFSKRILVKPGANPVEVNLEEWQLLSTYSVERRNNLLATEDLFKLAGDLSTNILVLGNVAPSSGGKSVVSAQLFDVRTREFSRVERMEVADAELPSSGRKIGKRLLAYLSRGGNVTADAKTRAEPSLAKSGTKQPPPAVPARARRAEGGPAIYEKWWFWSAIGGALLLGAGAFFLLKKEDPRHNVLVIDNPL